MADKSAMYYAAIMLNPTLKFRWFEERWSSDPDKAIWLQPTLQAVKDLYKDEYSYVVSTEGRSLIPSSDPHPDENNALGRPHRHKRLRFNAPNSVEARNDLDEYLARDPLIVNPDSDFDCLTYWFERRNTMPGLARMAFDCLAIPPSSSADERLFSFAGLLITNRRNRINSELIEANEFLRDAYGSPYRGEFDVTTDAAEYNEIVRLHKEWEEAAAKDEDN